MSNASTYKLSVDGMTCAGCVARVEASIQNIDGVQSASVNLIEGTAYVSGGEPETVAKIVSDLGYPSKPAISPVNSWLTLQFEQPLDETQKHQITDILSAENTAELAWENQTQCKFKTEQHPAELLLTLNDAEFSARILEDTQDTYALQGQLSQSEIRKSFLRASVAGLLGFTLMFTQMADLLPTLDPDSSLFDINGRGFWLLTAIACLFTIIYSGGHYYIGAWKQAMHRQSNMDTLIALGTAAAWISSLLLVLFPHFVPTEHQHLYFETSVVILAFLQFGHALETLAKARTGKAIGALIELAPTSARLLHDGKEIEYPVSLLRPGDVFVIRPGNTVATDGTIIDGSSSVDESMLTGESIALHKQTGDTVTGGTINQTGQLQIRAERVGSDTTLSKIIESVKQAQVSKPPIGRLVDKIASVFVPVVLLISVATFVIWWLVGPVPQWPFAVTTAIAILVIACPCALGLATPIAIMVGMGRAAQLGILIRNGDALQSASKINVLVVDKTGTLTKGTPTVTDIEIHANYTRHQVLQIAATLEQASEHPLAQAVLQSANEQSLQVDTVTDFHTETGQGVQGVIKDQTWLLGREEYLLEKTITLEHALKLQADQIATNGGTPIWLANETTAVAVFGLRDPLREDTQAAVDSLQALGVQIIMCTGDHGSTAQAVADILHIDKIHSRVLPQDKARIVSELQQQGCTVGMVGDGINDAPALAQAHVGFAVGSGTDVAISSADVTLANNSLSGVTDAISLSKATVKNIWQNLFGAFVYNVIGIPLAAGVLYPFTGWLLSPMFASAAMAFSSVTVVSNANRLRWFKSVK